MPECYGVKIKCEVLVNCPVIKVSEVLGDSVAGGFY